MRRRVYEDDIVSGGGEVGGPAEGVYVLVAAAREDYAGGFHVNGECGFFIRLSG
jgi:hypothetical protein